MTINTIDRNTLILSNLLLAEKIAKSKKRKLSHISFDELKSAAYLGLVEAANSYDEKSNDCFPAYAVWRIIGAIQDYLRELAWGPRSKICKTQEIHEDEFSSKKHFLSNEFFEDLVKQLPTANQVVIKLYYLEQLGLKEISAYMDLHVSRISQILSDSREKIRRNWKEQEAELWAGVA